MALNQDDYCTVLYCKGGEKEKFVSSLSLSLFTSTTREQLMLHTACGGKRRSWKRIRTPKAAGLVHRTHTPLRLGSL